MTMSLAEKELEDVSEKILLYHFLPSQRLSGKELFVSLTCNYCTFSGYGP